METTDTQSVMDAELAMLDAPAEAPETTDAELEVPETEEPEAEAPEEIEATEADDDEDGETDEAETDEAEDNSDDEEDADEDESDDLIPVMVDGKEERVSLEDLKRGYSGQAKIQRDMQQNAEARKQLSAAAQSLQARQQEILDFYARVQQQGFKAPPTPPDPNLINKDQRAYLLERERYEAELRDFQAEQAELQRTHQQSQQIAEAQRQRALQEQIEVAKQRIPELADPEKGPEVAKRLSAAATKYGYTAEEVGSITDARALAILHDAAKYRDLQAGKAKAKAPAPKSKNLKPKGVPSRAARSAEKQRKALEKAKRTQSDADWLQLL